MNNAWTSRYQAMERLGREAGKIALDYYVKGAHVETKPDDSPVTIADKSAEKYLRDELQKLFPDDGFLGEEYGDEPGKSGFKWIIDPIDGTRCFIRKIPHWATLIGLDYHGEIVAGIAYEPCFDRMYKASKGSGAFCDTEPIRVSGIPKLSDTLACYSGFKFFQDAGKDSQFHKLLNSVDRARGYGDYYGFVLVAQGSCDLMVDHGVHIWDIAALKIIVEEAGGVFTDWSGGNDMERPDCLASNGKVHAAALTILQG